jgi:hypothetical protein
MRMNRVVPGSAILLLGFALGAAGQTMVIHKSDGTHDRIPIADIAKLTFVLDNPVGTISQLTMKRVKATIANILPNPFGTSISYSLSGASRVVVTIHNAQGQLVETIQNEVKPAGAHTLAWDAKKRDGTRIGAGSYIVSVKAEGQVVSKALVLVK